MRDEKIIKINVRSAEEMLGLGHAFGGLYIQPLLASRVLELQKLVVAVYGTVNCGKTVFLTGCTSGMALNFMGNELYYEAIYGDRLFRYLDCTWNRPLESRTQLSKSGADFFEHAPIRLIESSGAAITIQTNDLSKYLRQQSYAQTVSAMANDAKSIGLQHQKSISAFLLSEFSDAKAPMRCLPPQLDIQVPSRQPRTVTIMRTTDHPLACAVFDNFRSKIQDHFPLVA